MLCPRCAWPQPEADELERERNELRDWMSMVLTSPPPLGSTRELRKWWDRIIELAPRSAAQDYQQLRDFTEAMGAMFSGRVT